MESRVFVLVSFPLHLCMLPFLGLSLPSLSLCWAEELMSESTVYVAGKTKVLALLHTHALPQQDVPLL